MKRFLFILITLLTFGCSTEDTRKYYFDSASGSDKNNGKLTSPWQTLDKLKECKLQPGDSVFLMGNNPFTGSLAVDSLCGSEYKNIVITSFNENRAVINSDHQIGALITNCKYVTIRNLYFTGSGRESNNTPGVQIWNSSNIILDRIEASGYLKSGILIYESDTVTVTNAYAHDNGFAGIASFGGKHRNNRIYIGYSKAERNLGDRTILDNHSGNGIILGYTNNALVEYCVATENGAEMPRGGNGPVGIWAHDSDSIIFQYNISHHNRTNRALEAKDGGGFDLDGGITNSVIQYCLSYENDGAGYGIFQYPGTGLWSNNTVRYCISENDGRAHREGEGSGFHLWSGHHLANFEKFYCYNNVVYSKTMPALGISISEGAAKYREFYFYNNIFFTSGVKDAVAGSIDKTTEVFAGNLWFDDVHGFNVDDYDSIKKWSEVTGQETFDGKISGISENPMFSDYGSSNLTDPTHLKSYLKYRLQTNSPAIGSGLNLNEIFGFDVGAQDFFGNPLPGKMEFNIGVFDN